MSDLALLLASASPRRKQLLEQLGCVVLQKSADIDETQKNAEIDRDYVLRLAQEKAQALVLEAKHLPVLAADTIISLDGQLIGKPADYLEACRIWQALSGRQHQVLTGVALIDKGICYRALSISDVTFAQMSDADMSAYWATGEPQDKAGAYAIQGIAARWISDMRGSYSGIMGLPLYETAQLLKQAGLIR